MSKQFTAVAALLLVEDGHLDLHESVDRWLPDAPPQWERVTLHHLLSHTAGVPHWHEAPGLDPAEPTSIESRLQSLVNAPLRSEPGQQWHYSSLGFLLVGLIIERASDQRYQDVITDRVIEPLALTRTTVGGRPSDAALGYNNGEPVTPFGLDLMPGTGDIWSTTEDLTRFTIALHSNELISVSSLQAMVTAHAPLDDVDDGQPQLVTTGYGYGTFTGTFDGHPAVYHPGDNPGYRSLVCWLPDQRASIAILANDESVDVISTLRQVLPLIT